MAEKRCLLTIHAHPDDESSKGAATVARYHDLGVHTVLVCCTGGEEGDILNPAMDKPEVKENIAEYRAKELAAATSIIGYDEVVMLGYRDSGMPGSQSNQDPRCFAMAPIYEAVGRLVEVVRRVRPQVIVTYPEEQTRYPHPDHIRTHEISAIAFDAAADPGAYPQAGAPFSTSKLYYTVWSVGRMRAMHEKFLELGLESPFSKERISNLPEDVPYSTSIDVAGYEEVRANALRAHATQVDPTSKMWFGLPPEVQKALPNTEEYQLARNRVGPIEVEEADLFQGLTALV
ncbi:MAG: mycothiol conjugate amidase Mca [Acidimicrobiales bacterium]